MASRFAASKLCADCGKPKGPNQAGKMRCYRCQRIASKKARDKKHGARIEVLYGITQDEYWRLYRYQGGRCSICMRATGKARRLAVDHDHSCQEGHDPKTGCRKCVRGLLCIKCNDYIGWLRDDPKGGERLTRYLTEPPWRLLHERPY